MKEVFGRAVGTWTGEKELYLTPDPDDVRLCNAILTARSVAHERFLELRYAWSFKGTPQEGLLLFGVDPEKGLASGAWVDSWHQSGSIMSLSGKAGARGEAELLGSYAAPPGPDWGWRIVIEPPGEDSLVLSMYNISPEGQEDLGVRLRLVRSPLV